MEGITVRAVRRDAPTGWYVEDERRGAQPLAESSGLPLSPQQADDLHRSVLREADEATVTVLAGPVDQSVVDPASYRLLAADLRRRGGTVVADLSQVLLGPVLAAGVTVLRMTHEELDNGYASTDDRDDLIRAMHQLRREGADHVVVGHGDQPALGLLASKVVQAVLPSLRPASLHGAGDAMTAGIAAALAAGKDLTEALRNGVAATALAAVVRHPGASNRAAVDALLTRVRVDELAAWNVEVEHRRGDQQSP
ncbi:PfkB family carbohydrate kinase [Micromonospora sp. NPDC049374]|uniref:PfkB family carbohydrate kinase n=1 Tax=Micromonospora sp. NPDC049374 TaxID=3154352 RepID=UPI00343C36EC